MCHFDLHHFSQKQGVPYKIYYAYAVTIDAFNLTVRSSFKFETSEVKTVKIVTLVLEVAEELDDLFRSVSFHSLTLH